MQQLRMKVEMYHRLSELAMKQEACLQRLLHLEDALVDPKVTVLDKMRHSKIVMKLYLLTSQQVMPERIKK